MAIEWDARVEHPFTFEQLRMSTNDALRDLIGNKGGRLVTKPILTEDYYKASASISGLSTAPTEHMTTLHGPWPSEDASVVFTLPELKAATVVHMHSPGVDWPASEAGWEDPEGGARCTVSAQRDGMSCVLAIATAVGAARTAGRFVWDESNTLGGDRIREPDDVAQRLRADFDSEDLVQAVNAVLAKTRIGLRWDGIV